MLKPELLPINDPAVWREFPAWSGPLSESELAAIQRDVDSIIGTTRGNESIVKIVWNGDRRYWQGYYRDWNSAGKPKGGLFMRPIVLSQTIYSHDGKLLRDAFPPRYLVLTRLEPEQYADRWAAQSKIYDPEYGVEIQILPEQPPPVDWLWFETIADHNGKCCQKADREHRNCYGLYAHPAKVLETLRVIQRGIEESGLESNPFATPDELMIENARYATANYAEQSFNKYRELRLKLAEESPILGANPHLFESNASWAAIKNSSREAAARSIEYEFNKLN